MLLVRTAARSPKKASSCFAVRAVTTNHAAQHDISRVPRAQQRGLASTASTSGSANHDELPDLTLSPLQQASGKRCAGRSVLLTGGTSGIGLAIAKLLIAEGAGRVLIPTRNLDRGQKAIKDIVESLQVDEVPVSLLEADLSQDPSTLQIVTSAMRALQCDTLISCAGTSQSHPITRLTPSTTNTILTTNLTTPIHLAQQFLLLYQRRQLRKPSNPNPSPPPPKSHVFIAISSLLATKSGSGASIYAASKAGLTAFTRTLALEAGEIYKKDPANRVPLRANVVVPGYVETAMTGLFSGEYRQKLVGEIPLGRFGTAEEVAEAVGFLVGCEYANNTVLGVDGGLSGV